MKKLKFDQDKADRLYSINTAETLEKQAEELTDLRIYHVEHDITGQPAGITQLADLYAKHIKKLSIKMAESITESVKPGDHQLSKIKNEMLEHMSRFINSESRAKNIDINEQLSLLSVGPGAISSVDNKFKKNITVTQNLCNNIIEEHLSNLESKVELDFQPNATGISNSNAGKVIQKIKSIKNHPVIVIVLFVAGSIIYVVAFTDALSKLIKLFSISK